MYTYFGDERESNNKFECEQFCQRSAISHLVFELAVEFET